MPFPLDPRVLALLSVFDDVADAGADQYTLTSRCEGQRYVYGTRADGLDVTVWTHSGTAWVCLRGLLSRRAAHALASRLVRAEVAAIVLNTAQLTLPADRGGTPLVTLCATLSYAGYSVTVVGRDVDVFTSEAASDAARLDPRPELLSTTVA